MNSKERVKASLHFKKPDRVPVFNRAAGDIFPIFITPSKKWKPGWKEGEEGLFPHIRGSYRWERPPWAQDNPLNEGIKWRSIPHEEIDEWGCIWNMKGNDTDMGHPGRASLVNWDEYDNYIKKYNPNANDETRFLAAHSMQKNAGNDLYKLLLFPTQGPSHVVSAMRGFNNYLVDHRKHPQELERALEFVAEYHVNLMKNALKNGINIHGIWLVDDLGEQKGPFFSPKTFKKHYESSYKYIIDEAHNHGLDVHLHCCGKIDRLFPVLIEWGLDAIELDSPRMSGYVDLRPYRGKIMFWGCVNIQSIYPLGTPEEVEREVWHMVRNLGTKNGGYGAYLTPDAKVLRATRANVRAFKKGLDKYGVYSEIPTHWWNYPTIDNWKDTEVPPLPPLDSN